MKLIKCIVRAHKVDVTTDALQQLDISGMTVTLASGRGRGEARKLYWRGTETDAQFDPQAMVDIVVDDYLVDDVVSTVMKTAYTGKQGDGRIFVSTIEEAYTIRTRAGGAD